MQKLKQKTLDVIVDKALELFLTGSVISVKIKDIADASGVGEATIYRYFSTKLNILEKCAVKLQESVLSNYYSLKGSCGYEKLFRFYNAYYEIFTTHPEFYKFISELDAFVIENHGNMEEYSKGIDLFKKEFLLAYNQGVADGSVKEIDDIETFYYSTTHALLELTKKLATNSIIVKQDELTKTSLEISTMVSVILYSLKK